MNIAQFCLISSILTSTAFCHVYADDEASLPTIKVMADAELRDQVVTTVTPFQEDEEVRKALQHQIIKKEQDIQNFSRVNAFGSPNIQQPDALPDMSNLTPLQRDYVLAVASGLQSSDPSSGIFKMLEPLGIDRDKALNGVRTGNLPMNLDENKLNQIFGDKWRGGMKGN